MEAFLEALASKNLVAWAIVVLVLVFLLKLLQSAGKMLLILVVVAVVAGLLMTFFPELMRPFREFIGGSWMN